MQDIPKTFPAPGWRKLADSDVIVSGDVAFYRDGHTKRSGNIGKTVAASTQWSVAAYYRKEETVSNKDKIQRLKALVDELAAASNDAAAESQKIAQERPKFLAADGTEIKVGDWLMWETTVEGASPDYGPVTKITDGLVFIQSEGDPSYKWRFSEAGVKRLTRIPPKPTDVDSTKYRILEPRRPGTGDLYYSDPDFVGAGQPIFECDTSGENLKVRWILEEVLSDVRYSDGSELKAGDWVSWNTAVYGASPDYGPVTRVDGDSFSVARQRCGARAFFHPEHAKYMIKIPAKPEVSGHKVLEYRAVRIGDTYLGTDGVVYVSKSSFSGTRERWILEKIQPKLLASDGKELKVGDWVSWDEEVACAEPDYGPVTYAEDNEVRVDRQRCGHTGYFHGRFVQKLNRIPAKPNPIPGYKILEPRLPKRGEWYWNTSIPGDHRPLEAAGDHSVGRDTPQWILEPEPQYRPFKDATEALAHVTRPIRRKSDGSSNEWAIWTNLSACILRRQGGNLEWVGSSFWSTMFENYTFEDGTPFGIKD